MHWLQLTTHGPVQSSPAANPKENPHEGGLQLTRCLAMSWGATVQPRDKSEFLRLPHAVLNPTSHPSWAAPQGLWQRPELGPFSGI